VNINIYINMHRAKIDILFLTIFDTLFHNIKRNNIAKWLYYIRISPTQVDNLIRIYLTGGQVAVGIFFI
jgi:hypothetical protein